jgi:hypothetical protein
MGLIEVFETTRPSNALYCHQEFLEKLAAHGGDPIGRRAAFLMQRLAVDSRRLHYKATSGPNRGWRRSRLGGSSGSHFYAWWAPRNAAPLQDQSDFPETGGEAVFLRDIRHHDDHSPLNPQSFEEHYLPVTVRELRREEYGPTPWTQPQAKFASARQAVRVLKGHPGSGKTTALWYAADSSGAERVLYVTYSRDLAALARDHFDRYCSSHKHFHVVTFPALIRQLAGVDLPVSNERESMQRFTRDLSPFARNLGPWATSQTALYDEFHAHLIGDALPVTIGRFAACAQPRVADKQYRERRTRFLGAAATASVLDAAIRLERTDTRLLAERYFPELDLAWKAIERLRTAKVSGQSRIDPALLGFDCIAVDECQDLTPMEASVIIELASLINQNRRSPVPLLLAGDEAQTVRPTDFEWGWLSDLLHFQIGTPSDHKLSANLRSPRRIAELVNRVWDLYGHVQKQDRPSGTGYAQIEDDATDQILYCTATPGPELDTLFTALAAHEGLALITLEDTVPVFVPEAVRPAVLTVREAKGLDFHSVCVIDAGKHIERIIREEERVRSDSDIEALRKRLAIDQLRVALSRPTERLLWLDVNPSERVLHESLRFLNRGEMEGTVASCVPAALLKTIEEEELDIEERVQRCQADARQYIEVKPEMAWSRAQQAITLLGRFGTPAAISDEAARAAAYLTLSEVCFTLALRNVRLSPELGRPDLFSEAKLAATAARRYGLAMVIGAIGKAHRASPGDRLQALADLAESFARDKNQLEPWVLVEVGAKSQTWVEELEAGVFNGHNAGVLIKLIPPFYAAIDLPNRVERTQKLQQRAIQLLLKEKLYGTALPLLRELPEPQPKLEALCHEGLNDFRSAAECYRSAGDLKEALRCYRSIPDMEAALKLVREIGDHPALESLEWVEKLQHLVAQRPDKFNKVMTAAEKKILEELLERSLGVARKKPATKKATTKKTSAKKTPAPRKRVAKKQYDDNDLF